MCSTIGSDNGFSFAKHQAIIWANADLLLIRLWGRNWDEIQFKIQFPDKKMRLKILYKKAAILSQP